MITLQLLVKVLAGDELAIERLRADFSGQINNLLRKYAINTFETEEDLFQAFFAKLLTSNTLIKLISENHENPGKILNSALEQTATDRARYWLRAKRNTNREGRMPLDSWKSSASFESKTDDFTNIDIIDLLEEKLLPLERELFFKIVEGWRTKEIAEHWEVSVSTASRWCILLRLKLEQLLEVSP